MTTQRPLILDTATGTVRELISTDKLGGITGGAATGEVMTQDQFGDNSTEMVPGGEPEFNALRTGFLSLIDATSGEWLSIYAAGDFTSDRMLSIQVGDANRNLTLRSNLEVNGDVNIVMAATAATDITLPTTGTLATLAGSESLSNKKLGSLVTNGLVTTSAGDGTLLVTAPGTGVLAALAANIGTAGAFVAFNGALGTPSSGNLANCTFPTLNQNTSGSSGSCTGNAATATALATSRTIGGSNFNGTADVTSFPSPGPIGGSTPSTIAATELNVGSAAQFKIDTSGAIGIGVTPDLNISRLYMAGTITGTLQRQSYFVSTFDSSVVTSLSYHAAPIFATGAAATAYYGMRLNNPTLSGTATLVGCYGLYIPAMTAGSATNRGLWLSIASSANGAHNIYADGTAPNYFAGNVAVGTTTTTLGRITGLSTSVAQVVAAHSTSEYLSITQGSGGTCTIGITSAGTKLVSFSDAVAATSLACPTFTSAAAMNFTPASGSGFNVTLATTGDFSVNSSHLYVDTSSGNVGIGTTSPADKLHIVATGDPGIRVRSSTGGVGNYGYISLASDGANESWAEIRGVLSAAGDGDLTFLTSTDSGTTLTEKMRVTDDGNFGVGTTSPSALIHGIKTTEQLRLGYNTTEYLSVTQGATGTCTYDITTAGTALHSFSDPVTVTGLLTATSLACPTYTSTAAIGLTPAAGSAVNVALSASGGSFNVTQSTAGQSPMQINGTSGGTAITNVMGPIIANTDQTANNWAGFGLGDAAGGAGFVVCAGQCTDHANNYGRWAVGTRAASGFAQRYGVDNQGLTIGGTFVTHGGTHTLALAGGATSPTLPSATADVATLTGSDRLNTRHAAAGNRVVSIQTERGSVVYVGDDAVDFAATTAYITINATDLITMTSTSATVAGAILSSSATGGVGYKTGAGGAVTQATSRTTGVTLDKATGSITLVSAAGLPTWQTFTVTCSACAAADVPHVVQKSGTDLYMIHVTNVAAGSFKITFATTGGTTTEQPVFSFAIIKGATS